MTSNENKTHTLCLPPCHPQIKMKQITGTALFCFNTCYSLTVKSLHQCTKPNPYSPSCDPARGGGRILAVWCRHLKVTTGLVCSLRSPILGHQDVSKSSSKLPLPDYASLAAMPLYRDELKPLNHESRQTSLRFLICFYQLSGTETRKVIQYITCA